MTTDRNQTAAERQQLFNEIFQQRNQSNNEQLMQRSQPFNELAALLGRTSNIQNPQFQNTPLSNIQPPNIAGTYNNNYAQQSQAHQQQQSGMMQGLGTLLSKGTF